VLSNLFFGLFLAKAGLDVSNPTIEVSMKRPAPVAARKPVG
jgi:hypothetical protein